MSSDSSEDSRRRHKHKKHKKEKKRKKHRHSESDKKRKRKKDSRRDYDSSSNSDSSEEKHRKRSKRDFKTKKRERKSSETKVEKQRSKYDDFVPLVHELLSEHDSDDLATELPYLLIRLASGATLNLAQMPNQNVAKSLGKIFSVLGCTDDGEGWKFDDGGIINHSKSGSETSLVLVKLSRHLMEEQGITMEAIEKFENQGSSPSNEPEKEAEGTNEIPKQNDIITEISSLT